MKVERTGDRLVFILDNDEKQKHQQLLDKKYKAVHSLLNCKMVNLERRLAKLEKLGKV